MGMYAHKLPPTAPTLEQRWGQAEKLERAARRASMAGGEYALEENQALAANEAFWTELEALTGLSRKQVEARL
ncbi:hypothetical protein [Qipengyuania sp. MTN3-11]|uniref:hypothetical protein n=1 Tax=Qipengyuania sp. MTN3-11 TaxID=3056557 RepID=UPI0036F33ADF